MIVLTVKTLDSQNHTFSVEDEITVEEFKSKIAETVNIPADTQRIIYCGRVLQDNSKLKDYDVNGKVVHLVQRAPPSQNPPTTRAASPQPQRRGFRGFDSGNTMYLGSMAFPSNLMESQGIVPPPPTHSLAGSRLNVARRMLRRADAVITLLENPSARPTDQPSAEEQQEEEVTPIIEARVIVPPGNSETIDEAMVLSAVQNSLFDATSGSIPIPAPASAQNAAEPVSPEHSASSTPEEAPAPPDAPNTEQRNGAGVSARTLAENASRTAEMAELLNMLSQLQIRFAPFLERYRNFMAEDPIIPQENVRQTQAMLTRVSEVLHFLGHAYHSLSDIIIRVRTPPPRPLLCRPILIQHSAVVQAGIPIQVEVAQFNLSAERNAASTTTNATSTTNTETNTTTSIPSATTATASNPTAPTPSHPHPTVNIRGFPFIPAASMRVQSFPIELRSTPVRVVNAGQGSQNNNNNTVGGTAAANSTPQATATSNSNPEDLAGMRDFGNGSVEFFMEVTPEVLQGGMNGPPPEFLTSLVQMAGQIINRVVTTTASSDTPTTSSTTDSSSQSSAANTPQPAAGQNSQARGNVQTHPTTATSTRSTPRPHVHLAQQAMQGGFDPFLPCNSHHVTHRRRLQPQTATRQQQSADGQPQEATAGAAAGSDSEQRPNAAGGQNLHNLFDEIYSSLRTAYRRRREADLMQERGTARPNAAAAASAPMRGEAPAASAEAGPPGIAVQLPAGLAAAFLPNLQSTLGNLPNLLNGPTIAEILQELPSDDQVRPGESIITDLIMLLSRNLTVVDLITLNAGNLEPLNRVTNDVRSFFSSRILDGSTSREAIHRGLEKFLQEMQPFFQNFSRLPVRDNIDMVRSVESLFRRRLPEIIMTAANLSSTNIRELVNLCTSLVRMLCALALHSSATGDAGVQDAFRQMINSYMEGIPPELQSWTAMTSCANLRHFMGNLSISAGELDGYLVRTADVPMATSPEQNSQNETTGGRNAAEPEPMDLDEPAATAVGNTNVTLSSPSPLSIPGDEAEPIPNVALGSDPWHGQVPEDWVPIITRDVQRQRRQNPQAPFSDAYLSGMPTKRRKIVNSSKPQGSLPQVIAESVRRAVTTTGLTAVAPLETVCQAAGDSTDVQTAYRSLLRTTVQTALRDNEDFVPERFPNASTYFKPQ